MVGSTTWSPPLGIGGILSRSGQHQKPGVSKRSPKMSQEAPRFEAKYLDPQLSAGRTKHEQLRDHILAEIRAGRLKAGDTLPSEQQLCDAMKVARTTVRQALAGLASSGILHRVPRKGTFVRQLPEEIEKTEPKTAHDVFALVAPELRTSYYPSLLEGFTREVARVNCQATIYNSHDMADTQARILMQLIDKRVGGVAMVPIASEVMPDYQVDFLRRAKMPVVFCHRRPERANAPLLALPLEEVGRCSAKTLVEQGHKKIALLYFQNTRQPLLPFAVGFESVVSAAGLQVQKVQLGFSAAELESQPIASNVPTDGLKHNGAIQDISEPPHESSGVSSGTRLRRHIAKVIKDLCEGPDRPTAIATSFDSLAETVYTGLLRLGLRVPTDVALIGFGDKFRRGPILPSLPSIVVDEQAVGQRAAEILYEIYSGVRPLDDQERIVIPFELYEGEKSG